MAVANHLIIGCGYLGARLREQLDSQHCWYTRRSIVVAEDSGRKGISLDVNNPNTWHVLSTLANHSPLVVHFMVPPGKVSLEQLPAFLEELNKLSIQRALLVSSTVVYGGKERVVDADSAVDLDSDRARRQYAIEQAWLEKVQNPHVIRMAGLYGPARIIGLARITQGQVMTGNPMGWLNLIRVEDAARLLVAMSMLEHASEIELGCDGQPLRRRDYYGLLAELSGSQQPAFDDGIENTLMGRCCNNELTTARTGWWPQYTDIRESLMELLELVNHEV